MRRRAAAGRRLDSQTAYTSFPGAVRAADQSPINRTKPHVLRWTISAGSNIFELRSGNNDWLQSLERGELREWQSQLQKGRAVIHMLCTRETRDNADSFARSCWRAKTPDGEEKVVTALRAFNASLRKEIGSE
ncbi:hypothetical protein [Actinoallomurus rhizosphaericola]|uniref:hypothetical protein n=1 Tax=Actinoallomurus rhizosphaericola TaxID=2952536 RepID=UPI0020913319|nr:hypothetical protein [Actinoallomurus rhizosphaericola]MCO5993021.1 hypothetical protein [Actinoallomurus rhizosphaericola]